jgi:hypothetical protein
MKLEAHVILPQRLNTLASMAGLLDRLDDQPLSASADQYRAVARQVSRLLALAEPDIHLQSLLAEAPAASELYENLRYAQAGLCRAPLDAALSAELEASATIARARRRG